MYIMPRFLVILLFLLPLTLAAQNPNRDSLAIVNARWQIDRIDGMVLKRMHFKDKNCLQSNQYVCVLEIPSESSCRLAFTCEPRRTLTTTQAQKHGAVAAINGSFFDMGDHYPICYLRIDGEEVGENTPQPSDSLHRKYYQYGSLSLRDGRPRIFIPDSARNAERQLRDSNIMTAGPLLIYEGRRMPMRKDKTFVTQRHNRTAVGVKADGTILLVTVDGRTRQSEGLSLPDLIKLLAYLGCTDALNLDGGGSTTMYVAGYPHNGIVNHPSDNGKYDPQGERPVSNCLIVLKEK